MLLSFSKNNRSFTRSCAVFQPEEAENANSGSSMTKSQEFFNSTIYPSQVNVIIYQSQLKIVTPMRDPMILRMLGNIL